MEINQIVKILLKYNNLSQSDFAKKMNTTPQYVFIVFQKIISERKNVFMVKFNKRFIFI